MGRNAEPIKNDELAIWTGTDAMRTDGMKRTQSTCRTASHSSIMPFLLATFNCDAALFPHLDLLQLHHPSFQCVRMTEGCSREKFEGGEGEGALNSSLAAGRPDALASFKSAADADADADATAGNRLLLT